MLYLEIEAMTTEEIQNKLNEMRFSYKIDEENIVRNLTFGDILNYLKTYYDYENGDSFEDFLTERYYVENLYDRGKKILENLAHETFSAHNVFSKIQKAIVEYSELEFEWLEYFVREFYKKIVIYDNYNDSVTVE